MRAACHWVEVEVEVEDTLLLLLSSGCSHHMQVIDWCTAAVSCASHVPKAAFRTPGQVCAEASWLVRACRCAAQQLPLFSHAPVWPHA